MQPLKLASQAIADRLVSKVRCLYACPPTEPCLVNPMAFVISWNSSNCSSVTLESTRIHSKLMD